MSGPVLRAQVVLSGRVKQASGLEWWWCQAGRAGAQRTVRSLVWIVHKVQRKEGRERFDLAQKTGRTWVGRDVYGCEGRWLILQTVRRLTRDGVEALQARQKFAVQPQRIPKGFSFSAGWLEIKYIL